MKDHSHTIILGASGWIGHYLIPALQSLSPASEITAVYRSQIANLEELNRLPTGTVINLTRGESEADYERHLALIDMQNKRSARYIYASSYNAVDADPTRAHTEADEANAQSDYGRFKARCEAIMLKTCARPLIFRFGAVHGWAPNRIARTQELLAKLKAGETVSVEKGVLQNRAFVGDLALQIAMLCTNNKLNGVFHLGTHDSSDELEFTRNLAAAFGYEKRKIVVSEESDLKGLHSIRINDQWRIVFRWTSTGPEEVRIDDYH